MNFTKYIYLYYSIEQPLVARATYHTIPYSYGFNGQLQNKRHNNVTATWGEKCEATGTVVGVAVDLSEGQISFGFNGNWNAPMGVAFTDIDCNVPLFPAISGRANKISVNFGEVDFEYGPPDASYKSLVTL